jgi:hypothetical protein
MDIDEDVNVDGEARPPILTSDLAGASEAAGINGASAVF